MEKMGKKLKKKIKLATLNVIMKHYHTFSYCHDKEGVVALI